MEREYKRSPTAYEVERQRMYDALDPYAKKIVQLQDTIGLYSLSDEVKQGLQIQIDETKLKLKAPGRNMQWQKYVRYTQFRTLFDPKPKNE